MACHRCDTGTGNCGHHLASHANLGTAASQHAAQQQVHLQSYNVVRGVTVWSRASILGTTAG
jgi:hypothetical protein